ncbi:hypothetical protein F5Y10DRAFT_236262 [Nemania abortiva]|nr:hypothetical protein F5Y10DRAFT_236262 [Nemania abortiva]
MAEALGVVASGIAVFQVATQIGNSIIKLKQLWDDLQDASSSIRDLLDQIECLDPALWEADHAFGHASLPPTFWNSSIASRSTAYCRKALGSLTEVVDELALQINRPGKLRSKVAFVKVALKKEQLKTLEGRLQNAVMMLTLAQQSYLVALTQIQPHIILQGFTEIAAPLIVQKLQDNVRPGLVECHQSKALPQASSEVSESAHNCEPKNRALARRRFPTQQDAASSIRFRLPTWLYRTTWELQTSRSYGNWKVNLQCYRIVPTKSRVFDIVEDGDPKELQMLFASGRASLYDRRELNEDTLLHVAIIGHNWSMIKHLLSLGADPLESNALGSPPWRFISPKWHEPGDALDEGEECICEIRLNSGEYLKRFQGIECPQHETTTLESRLRRINYGIRLMRDPAVIIPSLLQPYWGQDLRALCIASMETLSLIHIVAKGLGYFSPIRPNLEWACLADRVICRTPNIHHVERNERFFSRVQSTPLIDLIQSCVFGLCTPSKVDRCLKLWLSKVKSNGYSLVEYGRCENMLLADKGLNLYDHCKFYELHGNRYIKSATVSRLRGYEYGPEPEDWKILWSHRENSYAANFWRLVEDGLQTMPGAWVEDSDEDEDEDDDEYWLY